MEKRINVWLENPLFSLITEQNNPQIKLFRVMINSKRFIFSDLCFVQFVNCILYYFSFVFHDKIFNTPARAQHKSIGDK